MGGVRGDVGVGRGVGGEGARNHPRTQQWKKCNKEMLKICVNAWMFHTPCDKKSRGEEVGEGFVYVNRMYTVNRK